MLHASFIFRKSNVGRHIAPYARTFGLRDVNARITHTYIHSLICTSYFLNAVVVDNTILYPMLFLTLSL